MDIGAQYFTSRNPDFLPFLTEFAGPESFAVWEGQFGFQDKEARWHAFPEELRYVGTPRMTAVSRALSAHVKVVAETRIERMTQTGNRWILKDTSGVQTGEFDQVIITAPPAQARELLAQSHLPQLATRLDDAVNRVLPCWAVAAHFEANPWPRHEGMRCDHPVLFWVANNSSKPGREPSGPGGKGVWWVLHATPEWTQNHADASPAQVEKELVAAFRDLTGTGVGVTDTVDHHWLYARCEGGDNPGYLWFPKQSVGLAGDWLSGGRVEGAFDSACSLVAACSEDNG